MIIIYYSRVALTRFFHIITRKLQSLSIQRLATSSNYITKSGIKERKYDRIQVRLWSSKQDKRQSNQQLFIQTSISPDVKKLFRYVLVRSKYLKEHYFLKIGNSQPLFLHFRLLNYTTVAITDSWIQTADIRCRNDCSTNCATSTANFQVTKRSFCLGQKMRERERQRGANQCLRSLSQFEQYSIPGLVGPLQVETKNKIVLVGDA